MEQDQDQEEIVTPDITETAPQTTQEQPAEEEVEPTKTVKNFWERLDEVFKMNLEAQKMRQKVEDLLEEFPNQAKNQDVYRSFIFQPERLCISSNDDINVNIISSTLLVNDGITTGGHEIAETFSQFKVRFPKSLVNVKSIQLLSCVIPNAIQNIPNNQLCFFYYRIQNLQNSSTAFNIAFTYQQGNIVTYLGTYYACIASTSFNILPTNPLYWTSCGVNGARPNYFQLTPSYLNGVFLNPTNSFPPEKTGAVLYNTYNRTYTDYNDLVSALNLCSQLPAQCIGPAPSGSVEFAYNAQLNKIQLIPSATQIAAGYYFVPAGYDDPNIAYFMDPANNLVVLEDAYANFTPGYTLNSRCGFTWNGTFIPAVQANPYTPGALGTVKDTLYWYMRPTDVYFGPAPAMDEDIVTANSYGDLVNTSCVRIYCDLTFASTEDTNGQQGLLSVIPVNTSNLGVGFYQNNFSNPLTKIPKILSEISIRLVNDQGLPYILPNSATVLLELAMTYH